MGQAIARNPGRVRKASELAGAVVGARLGAKSAPVMGPLIGGVAGMAAGRGIARMTVGVEGASGSKNAKPKKPN